MNRTLLTPLLTLVAFQSFGQAPAGWKTVKDPKGACQMSVPADWTVSPELPLVATAPREQGDATLGSQPGKTLAPMNEASQKALGVEKMIENSSKLLLYATKPSADTRGLGAITPYRVRAAAAGGVCSVLIGVRPSISEDVVKKIAASVH